MSYDFYGLLRDDNTLRNMPPIKIKNRRGTDKFVTYNKDLTRLDVIAGEIYDDETLGIVILWANPEYFYEFDIPNNATIRIPFPKQDVLKEISAKILYNLNK